jgi:hypothetical protein
VVERAPGGPEDADGRSEDAATGNQDGPSLSPLGFRIPLLIEANGDVFEQPLTVPPDVTPSEL